MILSLRSLYGFSSQFRTGFYKSISDIIGLCMLGTVDSEIYYKHQVLKIFFCAEDLFLCGRKAVCHRLLRKSSQLRHFCLVLKLEVNGFDAEMPTLGMCTLLFRKHNL